MQKLYCVLSHMLDCCIFDATQLYQRHNAMQHTCGGSLLSVVPMLYCGDLLNLADTVSLMNLVFKAVAISL